jgi:hypothetical protein
MCTKLIHPEIIKFARSLRTFYDNLSLHYYTYCVPINDSIDSNSS